MGILSKAKVGTASRDASDAFTAGKAVFVARLWDEVMAFQGSGGFDLATDMINEVEAAGWRLESIAYSWVEQKKRGLTIAVFRRS